MNQESMADADAEHAALRELLARTTEAINKQDIGALDQCFSKPFVFTTVDQTVLTSTQAITAYYERMVKRPGSPISEFSLNPAVEQPTIFLKDGVGYCYGSSRDTYVIRRNGRVIEVPSRWTATVVKVDGAWKVAAVHTGVNFLENPVAEIQRLSWWRKALLVLGVRRYPGEVRR